MRARIAFAALVAIVAGALGTTTPAQAQQAPSVTVFEGPGFVCGKAGRACEHDLADPLWTKTIINETQVGDGLYWPTVGPASRGPFSLTAGPNTNAPAGFCVSTLGGPGCVITSVGELTIGDLAGPGGNGAYCGSSHGEGNGSFTSADPSIPGYTYSVRWLQSAGTILPLMGEASTGQTIVGFTSSRGAGNGEACGAIGAGSHTTQFQTEGMTIAF